MLLLTDARRAALEAARLGLAFLDATAAGRDKASVAGVLHAARELDPCLIRIGPGAEAGALAFRWKRHAAEPVVWLSDRLLATCPDVASLAATGADVAEQRPPPPLLETPRLLLTHPSPAQIDDYYDAIVGSALFDTLVWDGPASRAELADWWLWSAQQAAQGQEHPLSLAAIERSSGRYVGGLSLTPLQGDPAQLDLGYALALHAQGRGLGTEAVGRLVDEAFERRGAERIIAIVFEGNHRSRRLAEKLGFACEGTLRRAVRKRDRWLDEWLMAITRPDWRGRRQHLPVRS